MFSILGKKLCTVALFFFILIQFAHGQTSKESTGYELTIYVMPTMHPLDWTSPASLYNSMKKLYVKTLRLPDNYIVGHMSVSLKTPEMNETFYFAQTSCSLKEKLDLILKQKVGLGILGAPMQGRIEPSAEVQHKLKVYKKRNKLAFIQYNISQAASERIQEFLRQYSAKMNNTHAPSDFYGGAFWPLYHNEGAGCSAFGAAILDLIGLLTPETKEWKMDVRIPISNVGGDFNQGKKVKVKTIKNTKKWADECGEPNIDYINYMVYEPSIMFDWIKNKQNSNDSIYLYIEKDGVPGLIVDASNVYFDPQAPIFKTRTEPTIFLEKYFEKINTNNK